MKKINKFFAFISIVLITTFTLSSPAFALLYGDADDNGKITAADARITLRISAKIQECSDLQKTILDLDKNGKITAADARIILRIAAKIDDINNYGDKKKPSTDETNKQPTPNNNKPPANNSSTQQPTPSSKTVYITNTGDKYHASGCRFLSKSKISISLDKAKQEGYGPCGVCKP